MFDGYTNKIGLMVFILVILPIGFARADGDIKLEHIRLPPGFQIKIYARDLPNARSMALGPKGVLFVGTRRAGNIYAVFDGDQDGTADKTMIFAKGLLRP